MLILFLASCHNQIANLNIFDAVRKEKVTQNKYFLKNYRIFASQNFNSK